MVKTTQPRIAKLAEALAGAMPALQRDEQELALAVYHQLAKGEPVGASALASELGRDETETSQVLEGWPGVFRDGEDGIVGFWGLSIPEMAHRFRVDGRQLHTWCAWDALFIPELIGKAAEVESRPPGGGEAVRLTVNPDGIREVVPDTTVVSMLSPAEAFDHRVIMSFCHFVHFFPTREAGERWSSQQPGTFLLSVPEAHELGRVVNHRRFGAALRSER